MIKKKYVHNPFNSQHLDAVTPPFEWLAEPIDAWWDPTAGLPADPEVGDRYGSDATANGWTIDHIYEWNGTEWMETEPEEGWLMWELFGMILWFFFSGGWGEVGYDSYWSLWNDQTGITGDKTGSFNLTTTGELSTLLGIKIGGKSSPNPYTETPANIFTDWEVIDSNYYPSLIIQSPLNPNGFTYGSTYMQHLTLTGGVASKVLNFGTSWSNTTMSFGIQYTQGLLGLYDQFIISDRDDMATNWGHSSVSNPCLYIQSADATTVADYIRFYHDQTDGHIDCGAGDLKITAAGGDIDFDNENLITTGTLGAGAITGTSFIIGGNTLDTTEWALLDGQDQSVFTTSTPTFATLALNSTTANTVLTLDRTLSAYQPLLTNFSNVMTVTYTSSTFGTRTLRALNNVVTDSRTLGTSTLADLCYSIISNLSRTGTSGAGTTTILGLQNIAGDGMTYNKTTSAEVNVAASQMKMQVNPTVNLTAGKDLLYIGRVLEGKILYTPTITSGNMPAPTIYGVSLDKDTITLADTTPTYYAFYNTIDDFTTNWNIYNLSTANNFMGEDNSLTKFGTGGDCSIAYDGTNMLINPGLVGSGYLNIQGQILVDDKIMFTQTDGNEYIDSLNDGYIDIGATTGIRLLQNTVVTGYVDASTGFKDNGTAGIDTTFLDADGNTITVSGGIITAKTAP
jgi:hypothetical protein